MSDDALARFARKYGDCHTEPERVRVITHARIEGFGRATVMVRFNNEPAETDLLSFYTDELDFFPGEFIGLTEAQARTLHYRRDVAYLKS